MKIAKQSLTEPHGEKDKYREALDSVMQQRITEYMQHRWFIDNPTPQDIYRITQKPEYKKILDDETYEFQLFYTEEIH